MSKKSTKSKGPVAKIKADNERGARENILEDLFVDFHRSRKQVYKMNFIRGIFFGLGTVIGGTIIIAIVIWVLNLLVDVPGGIGEFVKNIIDIVETK